MGDCFSLSFPQRMSFSSDVDRKLCKLQMPLWTVTASEVCKVASLGKGKDSSILPLYFFYYVTAGKCLKFLFFKTEDTVPTCTAFPI